MPHLLSRTFGKQVLALCMFGTFGICTSAWAENDACQMGEKQIWSCEYEAKLYVICASDDLNASTGYMQYRVYKGALQEFVYPATQRHPKGLFTLYPRARGASLVFKNGQFQYEIYEPLTGSTSIEVSKNQRPIANLSCRDATDTLTLTSIWEFFARIGVYKKP